MNILTGLARRLAFFAVIVTLTLPTSGCRLFLDGATTAFNLAGFWQTTPLIPVTPYFTQRVEDKYWEEERYDHVPILDPVEGENAPILCLDAPSPDEVMRALPDETSGGVYFITETSRNNVRMVVEPIVDRLGECRQFPLAGPARIHFCHFKCTVYYDKVIRSDWPIPFHHEDKTEEVVYIDKNHLIRCAGPMTE